MAYQLNWKSLFMFATLALIFFAAPADAAGPRSMLMPKLNTIEPRAVELVANPADGTGVAIARQCKLCPITLNVDGETEFFLNGKKISLKMAIKHSGQRAAIQYRKSDKHAERIIW